SLDAVLPDLQHRIADARDRALARELSAGVTRWYFQLVPILDSLSDRPLKDQLIRAVLLCGLYQLRHTRIPPHAAISESVETVRKLGRGRATGLVNAVLRRYQRESDNCERLVAGDLDSRLAYPQWMVTALLADWPEDGVELLEAGNQRAPMWLRVNRRRSDVQSWISSLADRDPAKSPFAKYAVRLDIPMAVVDLPGFDDGLVSVQDAGAQLAVPLMGLEPGMRVLDACAAPGGKSCHMLESADISLTAVDIDTNRLERVEENFRRLGLEATIISGDVANPADWWEGKVFDRILLDVPCSATGVIRRHPDIKLLRRESDIETFAARQLALLQAAWSMLAPGGRLLYASCSVLRAENTDVLQAFLNSETRARSVPMNVPWGVNSGSGRQILTGEAGMDGFYYSILESV
ncbi:MAG: 16S rRNA (cytosine(967)-C(5))-methyltransferase RsmB, partial [Nitrosopumilus sp.]|nr:16S rRNA (cytosine(967)-C(5))-methyltransferase RsmB [Nitrosopumilus sp.]